MISANAAFLSDQEVDLKEFGIEWIATEQAAEFLSQSSPSVLALQTNPENFKSLFECVETLKKRQPDTQVVVLYSKLGKDQLKKIINHLRPFKIIEAKSAPELTSLFELGFQKYFESQQEKQLLGMINEKNQELKQLTVSLEKKVNDRQTELEESRLKNISAGNRLKILKETLVQIYQSSSIPEIERNIAQILKKEFEVEWLQIRSRAQSNLNNKKGKIKFYKTKLKVGTQEYGHIFFAKKENKSFDKKEKRFLNQVAEAVSLSIERTVQYIKSQELKTQWEATFDAISDPICLTDQDYNILRVNSNFLEKTQIPSYQETIGKKCYEKLFNRSTPCEGCHRGEIFQIRNPGGKRDPEVYDVYSNNLGESDQAIYFQMYRNVTNELNLQRQVIETAKMAELGTISSSIAHELNNPIGGMLNFVQLMKMDLEGTEEFYDDILEIEKGIIKCKNIVKNLLGFARKSFNTEITAINLVEVIEQAIKITELKTRSIGIKIKFDPTIAEAMVEGRFNLLTHAIRNVLQNSQESLIAKRQKDKHFQGVIDIEILQEESQFKIKITDNGEGLVDGTEDKIFDPLFTTKDPETNSGLGLTLALQIVKEHKGQIYVSTDKDKNLCINVLFTKSEA